MADTTAAAALIISIAALVVALGQLLQQILSTAYVLRKCDRIVCGSLTRGGRRSWHWRQFRFTVRYEALVFSLSTELYQSLGLYPSVYVEGGGADEELWDNVRGKADYMRQQQRQRREGRSRKNTSRSGRNNIITTDEDSDQACWVSFVETMSHLLQPRYVTKRIHSADRIPDDLTVAPTQVDAITVLLLGIASGMKVAKFSPTTGEINMSGSVGAITSAVHPVLGVLLHFTPSHGRFNIASPSAFSLAQSSTTALSIALNDPHGVWANAVLGRFNDRSFGGGYESLSTLRSRKMQTLREANWPADSYTDTIGGAACFLAFAYVDVYLRVPPSCVHQWCAHFAEVIVKAHLNHMLKSEQKEGGRSDGSCAGVDGKGSLEEAMREGMVARAGFIDKYGCSSPFLPWSTEYTPPDRGGDEDKDGGIIVSAEKLDAVASPAPQLSPLILPRSKLSLDAQNGLHFLKSADPSTYVSEEAAWELIPTTDLLRNRIFPNATPLELQLSDLMAAMAIRSLAETGAPSWPSVGTAVEDWPNTLDEAENELKGKYGLMFPKDTVDKACEYARVGLLRAAYYTIMMRAAGSVGPGIEENMIPTTALAYMA